MLGGIAIDKSRLEAQLAQQKPALVDKDSIHFSASALKTYEECPMKYKFQYVLAVPSPPKTYFDLGTAVHSVVEVLTRKQMEEADYLPTKEEAIKMLDHYWVSSSYDNATKEVEDRESAERMLDFFVKWCAERKTAGYAPFSAEKQFEIELDGKKVIGFIDRIDMTASGDYEVFDYKTGKSSLSGKEAQEDIQMNMYALAVEKLYGKLPLAANLLYLRKENKVSNNVTAASVAECKGRMVGLVQGIISEEFPPKPAYNTCRFCDYWDICEAKELEES